MKILSIDKYKGNTFSVKLEGNKLMYLHRNIISQYNLRADTDVPASALKEIFHASEYRKAKEYALYLLDVKDYSCSDMLSKLRTHYNNESVCREVTDYLKEYGFLNDERYGRNLARKLFEVKFYGKYRARREMLAKGLDKNLTEDIISEYDESSYERICTLIEKKYARFLTDEKGIAKAKNALVRLGYSYDEINSAFAEFKK